MFGHKSLHACITEWILWEDGTYCFILCGVEGRQNEIEMTYKQQ